MASSFTRLSKTGQIQTLGGFGLGHYSDEGFGQGLDVAINTVLTTTWTVYTSK